MTLTMATEALERQQTKKRVEAAVELRPRTHRAKPTAFRKNLDKNQTASLVSMLTYGNSMHSALTAIDRESNNNLLALPFPIIRWEDDDADDEEMGFMKKTESVLQEQSKIKYQKRKRCLRRSLACSDHLSLLAMDQIASMNENKEREQRPRKLRMMSCPY